ncbi:MAG: hypothetical protein LBP64_01075 [Tannerella sp.]|jgi:hypothetical protein|nr:hypothetical protein [Tannerella sp.]
MNKKTVIQRIIFTVMALIAVAAGVAWFILRDEKPWLAFYVACGGGVLITNLIIMLIFVRKNFK